MKINDTILDAPKSELKFPANQTIELTAIPRYGYRFTEWTEKKGEVVVEVGEEETISVTMTCGREFIANFVIITYKVSVFSSPSSGGEVILKPLQPQDGYEFGTEVTITARPAQGFVFKEWTGTDLSTTENSASYVATSGKSITAVFTEKPSNILGWVLGGVGVGIIIIGVLLYTLTIKKR